MSAKSKKECPECGGQMVIEECESITAKGIKLRRCDDFIEVHNDRPLEACLYEEKIYTNGVVVKHLN
jgi:ssDNA-binding Zn-finger/Zn-ribbon topoisomerase 1